MIILALYHHISLSGWGILVQHLHLFQAQVHLLIQVKLQATNHQGCHPQPHQQSLLTIISLAHPMCQVNLHPQLQVLYQPLSNRKTLVHQLYCNQAQFHLLVQVKILAINPQTFHLQSHQRNPLPILDLYHHMCQPQVHIWFQVL